MRGEAMMTTNIQHASRRGFLGTLFTSGAVVLGVQLLPHEAEAQSTATWMPTVYLGINPDGTVIAVAHRSEMGTGIRTALPMVLADELDADWKRVRIEQAIGDTKFGSQNTDGSCSIRDFYNAMRDSGASARLMLERAAAAKWNVPAAECKASLHQVTHSKSGKKAGYGELAALAAKQPVPAKSELKYKTKAEWRYIGKDIPITDQSNIVHGKGTFGMDAKVPGMVYAVIEHPPVLGSKVQSVDDAATKQVKGVLGTETLDTFAPPIMFKQLGGVAVIADSTWAALQGRRALKVNWAENPANASFESGAFKKSMFETARKPCKVVRNVGNVDAEFAKGGKILEAEYYAPLLSHAPMEPPVAVAEFKGGKVTAWAPTQNPQAVQEAVSEALGIKKEDVICHVTLLGGGFGRKSKPDYVVEAALLSRKLGKPVKVVWSREDDIRFDYFHSTGAMFMKAAVDAKGRPTAWLQRSVFPPIASTFAPGAEYGADFEIGMGLNELPFAIANHRAENGPAKNHIRIGWLRSVAHIYHQFAIQSFVDELAAAANRDRVEYYLDLIGPARKLDFEGAKVWNNDKPLSEFPVDNGRLRRVLEIVAEKSGWGRKKNMGIVTHRSFLTYVAAAVEVDVDSKGTVRIPHVYYAVDAGRTIHPDRVKSQFEGAAVFGTSIAMMGEITAAAGKIQQSNFHNYPVARMNEAPLETHVHVVDSDESPAGIGEPGVPPIAPAICNAIFAATGKRIRELPIKKHKLA